MGCAIKAGSITGCLRTYEDMSCREAVARLINRLLNSPKTLIWWPVLFCFVLWHTAEVYGELLYSSVQSYIILRGICLVKRSLQWDISRDYMGCFDIMQREFKQGKATQIMSSKDTYNLIRNLGVSSFLHGALSRATAQLLIMLYVEPLWMVHFPFPGLKSAHRGHWSEDKLPWLIAGRKRWHYGHLCVCLCVCVCL